MLTRKIYLTILFYLALTVTVLAQFDIRLTTAYGKMALDPATSLNISAKPKSFITAGLQADYYITDIFGIGIGADYFIKSAEFDVILSGYNHNYKGIDTWDGDPTSRNYEFTVRSNAPDIVEQNALSFVEFPVSAIGRFPISKNLFLATRFGVKAGLPLSHNYLLKSSDLYTRLYFEEWDLELFNIPAHGLYDSRTNWHPRGELDINTAFSVFTEIGLDFPVSLLKVRVSGYFSYGLNNIIDKHETSLIYWREDYNYLLSLPESVNLMQFGVKVGIGFLKIEYCPWELASAGH